MGFGNRFELVVHKFEKFERVFAKSMMSGFSSKLAGGVIKDNDFALRIEGQKRGFGGFENGFKPIEQLGKMLFTLGELLGLGLYLVGEVLLGKVILLIELIKDANQGFDFLGTGYGYGGKRRLINYLGNCFFELNDWLGD